MTKEEIEEDVRVTQYLGKDQKLVQSDVGFCFVKCQVFIACRLQVVFVRQFQFKVTVLV